MHRTGTHVRGMAQLVSHKIDPTPSGRFITVNVYRMGELEVTIKGSGELPPESGVADLLFENGEGQMAISAFGGRTIIFERVKVLKRESPGSNGDPEPAL